MTKRPHSPHQGRQSAIEEMRAASARIAQALHASMDTTPPPNPDTHPLAPDPLAPGAAAAFDDLRHHTLGPALTNAVIHLSQAITAYRDHNDMVEAQHQAAEAVDAAERAIDEEYVLHAVAQLQQMITSATDNTPLTPLSGTPHARRRPAIASQEPHLLPAEKPSDSSSNSPTQHTPPVALHTAHKALADARLALQQRRYLRALRAVDRGRLALQHTTDATPSDNNDLTHPGIDHETSTPEDPVHDLGPP